MLLASSRHHTPFCKSQSPNPIVENCRNLLHAMQNVSILLELAIRFKHEIVRQWSLQGCTRFESLRRFRVLHCGFGRQVDSRKKGHALKFLSSPTHFKGKHACMHMIPLSWFLSHIQDTKCMRIVAVAIPLGRSGILQKYQRTSAPSEALLVCTPYLAAAAAAICSPISKIHTLAIETLKIWMRKGMEIDLQNGLHVRMCVESQKKKTMKHACCWRRVLQPLNFLDAQNLLTHAFIFPKEKPNRQLQKPQKRNKWFFRNNSNNNNNKLDSSTIADTLESTKMEIQKKTSSTRPAVRVGGPSLKTYYLPHQCPIRVWRC